MILATSLAPVSFLNRGAPAAATISQGFCFGFLVEVWPVREYLFVPAFFMQFCTSLYATRCFFAVHARFCLSVSCEFYFERFVSATNAGRALLACFSTPPFFGDVPARWKVPWDSAVATPVRPPSPPNTSTWTISIQVRSLGHSYL